MVEAELSRIIIDEEKQEQVIVLREREGNRLLPIVIGMNEAAAIKMQLSGFVPPRPLTHDLLRNVLQTLGAQVLRVNITELRDDVFYARIVLHVNGREMEIDSRPSDALALAVRVNVPIFVAETVMDEAASVPEEEVESEDGEGKSEERLEVFKDFVDSLDLDDLDTSEEDPQTG